MAVRNGDGGAGTLVFAATYVRNPANVLTALTGVCSDRDTYSTAVLMLEYRGVFVCICEWLLHTHGHAAGPFNKLR